MKHTFFLSLLLGSALAGSAGATSILYFNDFTLGTDRMAEALASLPAGYSYTTTADSGSFASGIATGTYDIGIFAVQNSAAFEYSTAINALATFVDGGGRAIYSDWSGDESLAALFDVGFTGVTNNNTISVTDPGLASGITNPVDLYNPGWGVFSTGLTGGTTAAVFTQSGNGAIAFGNSGRSIVNGFLTDTFVDGAEGVQLYRNEIFALSSGPGSTVPDGGSTILMLGGAFLGFGAVRRILTSK